MNKISVAIIAYNEEINISDCLDSVSWADEIVVLDGYSSDRTAQIAKTKGARVFKVKNRGIKEKQMNLAFAKCTGEWILNLDADERVTPELKDEINSILNSDENSSGYRIPRKNIIFGKFIQHTGWYPDYQMRLMRRDMLNLVERKIHEELSVSGEIGVLVNPIEHLHYKSVSQFIIRNENYSTFEAERLISQGKKISWTDAIKFPSEEFFSRFFAREGYKDGLHGLVLSLLMAFYWEMIFLKIWEREGFWEESSDTIMKKISGQTLSLRDSWFHWMTSIEKSKITKIKLKIKKKISNIF